MPRSWLKHVWWLCVTVTVVSMCLGSASLPGADTEPAAPAAQAPSPSTAGRSDLADERELIRLFADTLEQVRDKYVESNVTDRELIEAAIQGMISRLDPYSNYIPPEELDQFRKGVEREFVGIGIQVSERDGQLEIISPLFGTPAWRGGLRAGDKILRIDETSTRGLSIDDAIKLMGGEAGSEVSVTVLHNDGRQAETVKLVRERIQQPTVLGFHRSKEGVWDYFCDTEQKIAYVRILAFSRNTSHDLQEVLERLLNEGMRGLVLDLRFNPGGMLSEAIKVCDLFLHEGRIVSIEGRSTPAQAWDAQDEGTLIPRGFPVAIMVNRFSASAAEIVSACLQDNKVATIVGERTWGKGSVQNIIELEKGKSALKLTTAGYHRPSGKNIHREADATETDEWGVHPDDGFALRLSNREMEDLGILYAQRDELISRGAEAGGEEPATDVESSSDSTTDASDAPPTAPGDTGEAGEAEVKPAAEVPDEDPAAQSTAPPASTGTSGDQGHVVDRQFDKALEVVKSKISSDSPGEETPAATLEPEPADENGSSAANTRQTP